MARDSKSYRLIPKVVGLGLVLALPLVISNIYQLHVLNLVGLYSMITLGLNLLSGYTGQVSMAQASYFAIGAYTAALLTMRLHVPFWVAFVAAAVVAAFFGALIGIPAMKLSGPYLVMATVGFGEIVRLVLINWVPVTRGANGITGIPLPTVFGQKIGSERAFYYLIYGCLFVLIVVALRLSNSKVGRAFVAIREDELAAEAMGVPTHSYKVAAFALAAAFAGIAGALYGPFAGVVSPDNFTFDDSVGFLCMSVVGGNRTIYGAIAGAFALTLFSEALRFLQEFRLIVYGAILLFTVIFMPNGFSGLTPALDQMFRRLASRMPGLVRTKRS